MVKPSCRGGSLAAPSTPSARVCPQIRSCPEPRSTAPAARACRCCPATLGARGQEQRSVERGHQSLECAAGLPGGISVPRRRTTPECAGGINFSSPFSSLDLRLKKDFPLGDPPTAQPDRRRLQHLQRDQYSRIDNTNYAGRNISIGPYQPAQNGQPAETVQANFLFTRKHCRRLLRLRRAESLPVRHANRVLIDGDRILQWRRAAGAGNAASRTLFGEPASGR